MKPRFYITREYRYQSDDLTGDAGFCIDEMRGDDGEWDEDWWLEEHPEAREVWVVWEHDTACVCECQDEDYANRICDALNAMVPAWESAGMISSQWRKQC